MQESLARLAEAREQFRIADPATKDSLLKEYGEGTLNRAIVPLNFENGGDIVITQIIAPVWDEERQGVFVPLLNITIDARNMDGGKKHKWIEAIQMAKAEGKRLFTKEEAVLLYWQKEAINKILSAHDGDLLEGWFWTDTEQYEYSAVNAWYVNFGSGYFGSGNKYLTYVVRAVAAY